MTNLRQRQRTPRPTTTPLRDRLAAAALTAFVAGTAAALMWLIHGFDLALVGSVSAVSGAVLGFCFGPRIGYMFIHSVG